MDFVCLMNNVDDLFSFLKMSIRIILTYFIDYTILLQKNCVRFFSLSFRSFTLAVVGPFRACFDHIV